METLILVLVLLVVWMAILWAFNSYVVLPSPPKNMINLLLVLLMAISLLWAAGLVHAPVR